MKVKDILQTKGPEVFTIGTEKPLRDAVRVLANNNIGSLIVIGNDGRIAGILSERDIIRASNSDPDNFLEFPVHKIMTSKVIVVEPDDEIAYVETVMTNNRIRHLPVLQNKVLVGIISIGDVVKHQLTEMRQANKYLMDYIGGNYS